MRVRARSCDFASCNVSCSVSTCDTKQPYWQGLLLGPDRPDRENLSSEGKENRDLFFPLLPEGFTNKLNTNSPPPVKPVLMDMPACLS